MKSSTSIFLLMFTLMVSLSSCEVIGGIFKAGFWTAVVLIVLVAGIILWLIGKIRRRR